MSSLANIFTAAAALRGGIFCALIFASASLAADEKKDHYRKWLDQDVSYIITREEAEVFSKLQTGDERDRFIEQFWERRNPEPGSAANRFKEEHYRRIQYVNDHFTSGIPGWKTDRGKMYIKFGPPDDITDYPAGSTYVRPRHEGGGTTLVHPFQVWRYNYIEGIGADVEIEFVDIHGGNLYRFARDELEKDALLRSPGLGLTLSEQLMGGDKTERIVTRHFADLDEKYRHQIGRTPRAKDQPFERLELAKKLEARPAIRNKDLQQIVSARISYSNLAFKLGYELLQFDETRRLVPVRVAIPHSELMFKEEVPGVRRAVVQLYGKVSALNNSTIREFEDTVSSEMKVGDFPSGVSVAQKNLLLTPGRYKLSVVVRDAQGGKAGTGDFSLYVPPMEGFAASSVFLADRIRKAKPDQLLDPLVVSGYKIFPNLERRYGRGQDVELFLELYNFARDQAASNPSLHVTTRILKDGKDWPAANQVLDRSLNFNELLSDRMLIMKKIPTARMDPGSYRVIMTFEDRIARQLAVAAADFLVTP